ncbi:hypothetical protein BaRGS_00001629 [Batillaria attramentaria]|uniref:Uncharacterized protein n=1 Tax=Batillaria attramentaria TaxID=370345 RepID=A0ABD0M6V2_9CAEN
MQIPKSQSTYLSCVEKTNRHGAELMLRNDVDGHVTAANCGVVKFGAKDYGDGHALRWLGGVDKPGQSGPESIQTPFTDSKHHNRGSSQFMHSGRLKGGGALTVGLSQCLLSQS